MGTLLLGMECWQKGQKGFYGASVKVDEVDPESLVTPWLITCWLVAVVRGLRRGHAALRRFYNLDGIHTPEGLGRSGGLLCSFWLEAEDGLAFPFDGPACTATAGARANFSSVRLLNTVSSARP